MEIVTLTGYQPKSGTSQRSGKPWTRHSFVAQDGRKFDTFNAATANAVLGLAFPGGQPNGVPLALDFTVEQNGQYTNYTLESAAPASNVQAAVAAVQAIGAEPVVVAPVDPEAARIARYGAFQHLPEWIKAGVVQVRDLQHAAELVTFFGKTIENGFVKTGASAPGAASSSGGVGEVQAGVGSPAPAAPVATVGQPVAQYGVPGTLPNAGLPDDGIPYL